MCLFVLFINPLVSCGARLIYGLIVLYYANFRIPISLYFHYNSMLDISVLSWIHWIGVDNYCRRADHEILPWVSDDGDPILGTMHGKNRGCPLFRVEPLKKITILYFFIYLQKPLVIIYLILYILFEIILRVPIINNSSGRM